MEGILFDFNGTMFLDSPYHWAAWQRLTMELYGRTMGTEEYWTHYHGMPNEDIFAEFGGEPISREKAFELSELKEARYRDACLEDPANFHLAPGLPAFLDALKARGVKMGIATSVCLSNLEFYFEHLGLDKWITLDRIVYDDGTRPGKPNPDGYLELARRLGVNPANCVGFEDSFSGLTAIHRAGVGRIFCVDGDGKGDMLKKAFPDITLIPDYTGLTPEMLGF